MLYTNTLDTEQKLDRHLICGSLPMTTELNIALADLSGRILPETVHGFRVNQGSYGCTTILRNYLADGGLLSGRTVSMREFAAVRIGYSASNFKFLNDIPVRNAKYLFVGTHAPQEIPASQLKKTQRLEQNPYHRDKDEYLASMGAGMEAAEYYQNNLLVSQSKSSVPTAVLAGDYAVVPIPFCTLCRIALKRTSKDLVIGLRVQFRNI